jgi:hypothetical protein
VSRGVWAMIRIAIAFIGAGALIAAAREARAGAFALGLGAELSQAALPAAAGANTLEAVYLGPGVLADARLRLGGASSFGDFGVDLFGGAGFAYHWNTAEGASEALRRIQYLGGLDVRTSWLFVGAQVALTQATVRAPDYGATTPFAATSLGLRAGINWMVADDLSLMTGVVYQAATAYAASNALRANQPINQISVFLMFHLKAVSQGSSISGSKR